MVSTLYPASFRKSCIQFYCLLLQKLRSSLSSGWQDGQRASLYKSRIPAPSALYHRTSSRRSRILVSKSTSAESTTVRAPLFGIKTPAYHGNGIKRICRLIEKIQKGARIYGTSVGEWMASQAPQAMHHLRHDYSWQVELRSEFENSPSSLTNDPPLTIYELREIPARWALTSRCWCRT